MEPEETSPRARRGEPRVPQQHVRRDLSGGPIPSKKCCRERALARPRCREEFPHARSPLPLRDRLGAPAERRPHRGRACGARHTYSGTRLRRRRSDLAEQAAVVPLVHRVEHAAMITSVEKCRREEYLLVRDAVRNFLTRARGAAPSILWSPRPPEAQRAGAPAGFLEASTAEAGPPSARRPWARDRRRSMRGRPSLVSMYGKTRRRSSGCRTRPRPSAP